MEFNDIANVLVRHTGHITIATRCIAMSISVPMHLLQPTGTMFTWYKTCITSA